MAHLDTVELAPIERLAERAHARARCGRAARDQVELARVVVRVEVREVDGRRARLVRVRLRVRVRLACLGLGLGLGLGLRLGLGRRARRVRIRPAQDAPLVVVHGGVDTGPHLAIGRDAHLRSLPREGKRDLSWG